VSDVRRDAAATRDRAAARKDAPNGASPRRANGASVGSLRAAPPAPWTGRLAPQHAPTLLAAVRERVRRRFLVDMASLTAGVAIAGLYDGQITTDGLWWAIVFVVLTFLNLKVRGLYAMRLRADLLDEFSRIVAATSVSAIMVVGARIVGGANDGAALQGVKLWAWSTIMLTIGRAAIAVVIRRRQRAGVGQLRTLVIGADAVGHQIARRLLDNPELGLRPVGFVDDQLVPLDGRDDGDVPVLGTLDDIEEVVVRHDVRQLIVGYAAAPLPVLTQAVRRCRRMGLQIATVPRLYEDVNRRIDVEHIGGIPLLSSEPADPHSWRFSLKYGLDRVVAALLLLIASPLLIAIAIAVRLSSPGPVFYRQPRVSLDGREFQMLKFRTMHGDEVSDGQQDAHWAARTVDESHDMPAAAEEDRRTLVGRFLRRYSLDEVPQLINVLRGDMSLVGPRPERTSYVRLFSEHVPRYGDRHRVKSGLTGWAQVHGLRGETSLADRVEWDNWYIANWSLRLDFKILFLTLPAMLTRRGH
jgi:exopolysaccharide biosynthesis polyprenyl glycosylphosphotransferase